MPRHLRIFLASPSDVSDERQIAFETMSRLPYDPLLRGKVTLEVVAWDGPFGGVPILATVDPQSAVSMGLPLPSECDIVIVILHGRFGTPLPAKFDRDGQSVTGTEWEYREAIDGFTLNGSPDVLVFRKTAPVLVDVSSGDPSSSRDQALLVDSFFERMRHEKRGFRTFADTDEFAEVLTNSLKGLIDRLLRRPNPRDAVLMWARDGAGDIPMESVTEVVGDPLTEPYLKVLVADRISASKEVIDRHSASLAGLARVLLAFPEEATAKAGLKLAKRLIEAGHMQLTDLRIGAANSKWEVKAATVAVVAGFEDPAAVEVYEGIGRSLSYWRPVQTMTEHLLRLVPLLSEEEVGRASVVLETLLANPRQSDKQQVLLRAAIEHLGSSDARSDV